MISVGIYEFGLRCQTSGGPCNEYHQNTHVNSVLDDSFAST